MLPTKTRPKRLLLIGSDGREYNYLLKGREDLHLDERIMQLLRVVNGMLRTDRHTRDYPTVRARHYAVLPLGARSGLIQWVEGVTPLFTLYKAWQVRPRAFLTPLLPQCAVSPPGILLPAATLGLTLTRHPRARAQLRAHAAAALKERSAAEAAASATSNAATGGKDSAPSKTVQCSSAAVAANSATSSAMTTGSGCSATSSAATPTSGCASAGTTSASGATAGTTAGTPAPPATGGAAGEAPGSEALISVRPAEIFYSRMTPALQSAGLSAVGSRRAWPHELLRRVHGELVAETPRELLAQELWLQSTDSHEWWLKTQASLSPRPPRPPRPPPPFPEQRIRSSHQPASLAALEPQAFARSCGVMSMLGYAIGLGDRHLDNILLDLSSGKLLPTPTPTPSPASTPASTPTPRPRPRLRSQPHPCARTCTRAGELLHIDYNVCFEKGLRLKVPETVPFRMTQTMQAALGIGGARGLRRTNERSPGASIASSRHSIAL